MPRLQPRLMIAASIAALASCFTTGVAALEFHGYARTGVGKTEGGGKQSCFQAPGSGSKYRLGNECETYGEAEFGQQLYERADGLKVDYHVMASYGARYTRPRADEGDTDDREVKLRQNWIGVQGVPGLGGGGVWIGKRYYKRQDVHITDFYYRDVSGDGGGIEDLPIGPGKFSYALFRNTDRAPGADPGETAHLRMTRHDFRYDGIPLGAAGTLEVGVNLNRGRGDAGTRAENGRGLTVQHTYPMFGGYNKLAVQWAKGSLSGMGWGRPDHGSDGGFRTWRIVDHGLVEFAPAFSGMYTVVHEDRRGRDGAGARTRSRWTSLGLRPVWHLGEHFKLQAEIGHDRVDPDDGGTRKLTKLTVAPTLVSGRGFFARPELRLFVTHARWNAAARDTSVTTAEGETRYTGVAGGPAGRFGSDTHGTTWGIQAESWW